SLLPAPDLEHPSGRVRKVAEDERGEVHRSRLAKFGAGLGGDEVRMAKDIQEQLTKYFTAAPSIEAQALAQLRRAPDIASDTELGTVFEQHLAETEKPRTTSGSSART